MGEKNIYRPIKYKVDKIVTETPLIKTFFISADNEFEFKTGQFVEVTLDGIGEAPYTPSSSPYVKNKMELTIMNAGYVTNKMHELKGGETIGIRGPYGKGYPIEKFYGKEILILGGGVEMRYLQPRRLLEIPGPCQIPFHDSPLLFSFQQDKFLQTVWTYIPIAERARGKTDGEKLEQLAYYIMLILDGRHRDSPDYQLTVDGKVISGDLSDRFVDADPFEAVRKMYGL